MSDSATYDVLVVGAGLFGSVVAHEARKRGMRVLVLERREHLGGMCYSFEREGIVVHAYGPHILHMNNEEAWNYVSSLVEIEPCMISPVARFGNRVYNLPFNMNTFNQLWGVVTPEEARARIEQTRVPCSNPANLEEHVLDMVGTDIYETLVKGYTEKQYGRPCSELPASIISRMPLLFVYDNDYCHTRYQGIPAGGYQRLFQRLLEGCDVKLGVDYIAERDRWDASARLVVFTGQLDELYDYRFGPLEYRGRRFVHEVLDEENHQGTALVNYTDASVAELRTIEHKHFVDASICAQRASCAAATKVPGLGVDAGAASGSRTVVTHEFAPCAAAPKAHGLGGDAGAASGSRTVVTHEFATEWKPGDTPYYPIDDETNRARYARYRALADARPNFHVGGRLAEYRYFDMEDTIISALAWVSAGHFF